MQSLHAEVDKRDFKGTLFELAGVGGYAGIEELWFDDLDASAAVHRGRGRPRGRPRRGLAGGSAGSFSLVTTERVVYDYTRGAESSPAPAVLDPDSLEAAIDGQGYRGWNVPGWESRAEGPRVRRRA